MSGRRQSSMPVTKRRRVRGRESGSSSNGESSNVDRTQRQQPQLQQTVSPSTVAPLPVVNPASSRPAAVTVPSGRLMDNSGDQVAPASPKASRRISKATLHVSEQMPEPMDPTIHHQVMSLPKEAFRLSNTDFICPICFEVLKEPFITHCGHTFCYNCITASIKSYGRCPMCNEALNEDNLIANTQFNEVIYKFRKQQQAEKLDTRELPTKSKDDVLELLRNFSRNDKECVRASLVEMMKNDEEQRKKAERQTSISFLTDLRVRKLEDIEALKRQVDVITEDIDTLTETQRSVCSFPSHHFLCEDQLKAERTVLGAELCTSSVSSSLPLDELPGPSGLQSTQSTESTHSTSSDMQKATEQCSSSITSKPSNVSESAIKKWTIESYFDEIAENYIQARVPVLSGNQSSLEEWEKSLNGLTRLKKFRELGTLMYGDPTQGPSIVSSIDFDKDQEFFAVGGVTRQLKVYEYNSVITRPVSVHYPVQDLSCASKISSVSFNYFMKNLVASCDYDGTVIMSDVSVGRHLRQWKEHEKRCWSVHFNHFDPKIVASGSDDFKIKIWVYNVPHSVGTVNAEANVCCVRFHPASRYYLAYGCADHKVYYYDLRDLRQPLSVLEGHKKAVSYCQFLNHKELVSLSTDSEMKLWDVNTGRCIKTYHGHKNDKNFVGLTAKGSHIVCGSENNSIYCYYRDVSKHVMTYRFNVPRSVLPGTVEPPDNPDAQFVSAVCWKPRSSVLLAANSQGYIKILEAV